MKNLKANKKQPLLSVVVPCYNVEKYVRECILSIMRQSYKNIEIICVDDASPDNSMEIVQELAKEDNRIKIVRHEKNRGLFHARLTGVASAHGNYIAFVDSDDYVSSDWFRPLIKAAEKEDADMALGNTINVDEAGRRTYYNNYRSFNVNKKALCGDALISSFLEQKGECFVWHTVWNKVYNKRLFDKAWNYLIEMPEPLIMGEDIAFSTVFYSLANKLVFVDNDCYFYYRHKEASTSITLPKKKILKNIRDIVQVFSFAENFLRKINRYNEFETQFIAFKDKYFRIWSGNIIAAGLDSDKEALSIFLNGFNRKDLARVEPEEFYFYDLSTEWDDKLEEIKYAIVNGNYSVISFDIFDTLIKRPFWDPRDILYIVAEECSDIIEDSNIFYEMRLEAENACRNMRKYLDSSNEDITLSEIYSYFGKEYGYSDDQIKILKEKEEEIEYKFCEARRSGKEIYELARYLGYDIVLTSDMYLEKPFVEKMLKKCGYFGYKNLFLSSDYRKLKPTGTLFSVMLKETGVDAEKVLHIGDNWSGDIESAQKAGLNAKFLPKAIETFSNNISNIYTGDSFKNIYLGNNNKHDSRCVIKQLPLRCLYATAVNDYFDNPFRSFNKLSHYNADAYYIGYCAMGMHILGLAYWIDRKATELGYSKIVFLARDGYLVKKVFDEIQKKKKGVNEIKSDYFYATRKSLFPYLITKASDLYQIYELIDVYAHTPQDILNMFQPVCKEMNEEIVLAYNDCGIELNKKFTSKKQFFGFIKQMIKISYVGVDTDKLKAVKEYFSSEFDGKVATFDIGYSGRLQKIICDLAGKQVDVFFVHDNGYDSGEMASKNGFKIYNFYEYTPKITAILREYLISDPSDYCAGYSFKNGTILPELKDNNYGYAEMYAVKELHRGVVDYCCRAISKFGEQLGKSYLRAQDISVGFENFLVDAPDFDRRVFINSPIEDEAYSNYTKKNFYEVWNWHLEQMYGTNNVVVREIVREREIVKGQGPITDGAESVSISYDFLNGKNLLMKGLFYWLFDREAYKAKRKARKEKKKKK